MTTKTNLGPTTLNDYLALPYRLEITPNEHGGFVVRYPDLLGCVTQVERIEDAIPMAQEIFAGWLEIALEDGAEIPLPRQPDSHSGKFVVRIPKSLHRTLAEQAEGEGVSLNQYTLSLLAAGHSHQRLERRFDELCAKVDAINDRLRVSFDDVPWSPRVSAAKTTADTP